MYPGADTFVQLIVVYDKFRYLDKCENDIKVLLEIQIWEVGGGGDRECCNFYTLLKNKCLDVYGNKKRMVFFFTGEIDSLKIIESLKMRNKLILCVY